MTSRSKMDIYSLKPPFVATDNTRWETGAGTTVEADFVRLTQPQPARQGYLWGRIPAKMTDWEVVFEAKIHSEQPEGGEGMAFWFTSRKMLGPVFGSSDYWEGLAIIIDTYNNDKQGVSPIITAIVNDGTMQYSAHDDGQSQSIGGCTTAMRNSREPFFLRVTYLNSKLSVEIAQSVEQNGDARFENCFMDIPLALGVDKYLGFSASTAHTGVGPFVSDNHDIYQVLTHDLSPNNNEERIIQRREEYRREVEEEHRQSKQHVDLSDSEFYHIVTTSLNQLASQLTQMDNIQLGVERHISELTNMVGGGQLGRDVSLEQIRNRVRELSKTADKIVQKLPQLNNPGRRPTAQSVTADPAFNEMTKKTSQIQEQIKGLASTIDRYTKSEGAKGGRRASRQKDPREVVKESVKDGFKSFETNQERVATQLQSGFDQQNGALMQLSADIAKLSGGSSGWLNTIMLFVSCVCGAIVIYSQVSTNNNKNQRW